MTFDCPVAGRLRVLFDIVVELIVFYRFVFHFVGRGPCGFGFGWGWGWWGGFFDVFVDGGGGGDRYGFAFGGRGVSVVALGVVDPVSEGGDGGGGGGGLLASPMSVSFSSSFFSLVGLVGTGGSGWARSLLTMSLISLFAPWYRFAMRPTSDRSRLISLSREVVCLCQLISAPMSGCAAMASVCLLLQLIDMLLFDCFPMVDEVSAESGVGVMPTCGSLEPVIVR